MKTYRLLLILCLLGGLFHTAMHAQKTCKIDLSGQWTVALDSLDRGIAGNWQNHEFGDMITLPGTLCDAGYGTPCAQQPVMEKQTFLNLKRKFDYVGPAWYRRTVDVPADWKNHPVVLELERVLWRSDVWVNGQKADGYCESLTTPHRFDVGPLLRPGQTNVIVVRVDNRKRYDTSENLLAHAYTNETQTIWNGMLGRMELIAHDNVSIKELRLTPDIDKGQVNVKVCLDSNGMLHGGKLIFSVKDPSGRNLSEMKVKINGSVLDFSYPIPDAVLWDEFSPSLYQATAAISAGGSRDTVSETFGMRKLSGDNALLHINGRRMFLRGTLECCIFPLLGYPPADEASWHKVFDTARSYGLNHLRFHSWCPPEAAFNVADSMGFYLQIELPVWSLSIGSEMSTLEYLRAEGHRIISEYGNHPSFCFFSMGNELQSDFKSLGNLMADLRSEDHRHLYTTTTFTFEKGHGVWPEPGDDYWISQWTKKGWVRGQGVFDESPVNFEQDYSASVDSLPVPIVTHEIGQYSVFPNLDEIDKYTGNLVPVNFKAVKLDLERKERLAWARQNLMASGHLAAILYKEEIERALKTPGFSGFQLLDLHDFPGQGTALVGLLDAFWDSKGIITSDEFRRFCSPVVPLARFAKATYTNEETFRASIEVANFGPSALQGVTPSWALTDERGNRVAGGELARCDIAHGNGIGIGRISVPLNAVNKASRLTLTVKLGDDGCSNSWNIWVYPQQEDVSEDGIIVTRSFSEARRQLARGRKVLLNPSADDLNGLEGKFVQVFWSPVHFPNQAGTMGIWCDPSHPALADFPTENHSNWQWWDVCKKAKTLVLDSLDAGIEPIVRMTDNFYKNRNLALVFEAKVGNGKLLMCSSDLFTDIDARPVARQLRRSLVEYMSTDKFNPSAELTFDKIEKAFYNVSHAVTERKSIYD